MPCPSWLPAGLLLLAAVLAPGRNPAQPRSDSLRAEALQDFHGPDRTGKDGPLAKAGLDLLLLYHEYRAFRQEGGDSFAPSVPGARVTNGHVSIDAIARTSARKLRADLSALGLTDAATAGRVVSGRLPIDRVPALTRVASLRGVVLPRAKTQGRGPSRPRPGAGNAVPNAAPAPAPPPDGSHSAAPLFFGAALGALFLTEG
jgi:hypothetical protein